jgi:TctA family transporter
MTRDSTEFSAALVLGLLGGALVATALRRALVRSRGGA